MSLSEPTLDDVFLHQTGRSLRDTGESTVFLPGILALLAFSSGTGPGLNTLFELRAGVIERFRVTPASRFAILVGPILASMLMMFVFDAVVVAAGAAFGFHVHWPGLVVLAVLLPLCALVLGWATGVFRRAAA
jgi:ABC-2 type transport system permease protein